MKKGNVTTDYKKKPKREKKMSPAYTISAFVVGLLIVFASSAQWCRAKFTISAPWTQGMLILVTTGAGACAFAVATQGLFFVKNRIHETA
jgi:hypothetical protein